MINGNDDFNDKSRTQLALTSKSLQSVGFIQKFLQGYSDLKVLDLTDNKLGNRGAIEITQLIEHTQTIEVLALRNNRIGPSGLQHICSSLTLNSTIKVLDIRDNMI
jgi:Ran GTPase-activating protein (RanGAP) involved in mRNA processing and transport